MSDILIHIDEDLGNEAIYDVEAEVSLMSGVYSACVNERTRHLMVVDYDGTNVSSGQLLNRVRSKGLHAELVGL